MARAAKPTEPATTIQAAAMVRPVHPIRITTGSRGGPVRLTGRPFAVRPFPAAPLAFFFFWPERAWFPRPGLLLVPRRAADLVAVLPRLPDPPRLVVRVPAERPRLPSSGPGASKAASATPPRGRADPLRARGAIVTNVARTCVSPKHPGGRVGPATRSAGPGRETGLVRPKGLPGGRDARPGLRRWPAGWCRGRGGGGGPGHGRRVGVRAGCARPCPRR